jgi:hypothetical protein
MAFQRFDKTGRGYTPKAAIWSRGQIGFNRGACEKYRIADFSYVGLYFDVDTRRIGFKFTNDPEESGVTKIIKGKTGAFISAGKFLDYYEIPHPKTKKYPIKYDKDEELYVIELPDEQEE